MVFLTGLGLFLYISLRSVHFDLNGIAEALAVERGGQDLYHPNHMLYRPIVHIAYMLLREIGYQGRSIFPAQTLTGIIAALALGLHYRWLRSLIGHRGVAAIASIGFGTSWAFWVFSTDASYIVPAATATIAALLVLSGIYTSQWDDLPLMALFGLATLVALAILLWQANVFLVPTLAYILLLKSKENLQRGLTALTIFVMTIGSLLAGSYLLVGKLVLNQGAVADLMTWPFAYGGARLPMWGNWDAVRLPSAIHSYIASIIPLWEGLGIRALLKGEFQAEKFLSQLSLLALVLLVLFPIWFHSKSRSLHRDKILLIGTILLGSVLYWPFLVWWDPFEPKWFVITSIGMWGIIALLWEPIIKRPWHLGVLGSFIAVMAAANLTATIWPRHQKSSALLDRAQCVAGNMATQDLFVSYEWSWSGYLTYFYDKQVFSLISAPSRYGGKEQALTALQAQLGVLHHDGSQAFVADIKNYPQEHFYWLASQTDLSVEDIRKFEGAFAFSCAGFAVNELINVR